jgi:hypothetical protein
MQRTWRPMRQLAGEADADKSVEELDCAKSVQKLSSCRARQDSERLCFQTEELEPRPGLEPGTCGLRIDPPTISRLGVRSSATVGVIGLVWEQSVQRFVQRLRSAF